MDSQTTPNTTRRSRRSKIVGTLIALAAIKAPVEYSTSLGFIAGIFFGANLLAGLSALLASHPVLATALRSLGAAYLVWYGFLLLRSALAPLGGPRSLACPAAVLASRRAAYRAGLLTGLTNPKAAAFWTSVFATT